VNADGRVVRNDPSKSNTSDFEYSQQATIISNEAHHGGGDVAVYATGMRVVFFFLIRYYNVANIRLQSEGFALEN